MNKIARPRSDEAGLFSGEDWFDPFEAGLRGRIRGFIEELLEGADRALGRAAP